jgi:hypothetical protein
MNSYRNVPWISLNLHDIKYFNNIQGLRPALFNEPIRKISSLSPFNLTTEVDTSSRTLWLSSARISEQLQKFQSWLRIICFNKLQILIQFLDLRSSGKQCSFAWQLLTVVAGQRICSNFKGQEIQDFLILESGTDRLSRNVVTELPFNAALYARRAQI